MLAGMGAFGAALMFMDSKAQKPEEDLDVVAAYVTVTPHVIHPGDKVVLEHGIRSQGKSDLPAGYMEFVLYVEGKVVSSKKGWLPGLPGGGSDASLATGFFQWKAERPGTYRYRLIVDEAKRVAESNETNNIIEGELEVVPRIEAAVQQ